MLWVGIGLAVFGLSNFVFLAMVGRGLGPADSAPVAVAWTAINVLGIGLFQPLEQETGRMLSGSAAAGRRGANLSRMFRYALIVLVVLAVLVLAANGVIADLFFSGSGAIVVLVALGIGAQAVAYYARGVLAGTSRFDRYGQQLTVDGLLRIGLSAALFVTGSGTQTLYCLIVVVAPLVATVVTASPRMLVSESRVAGAPVPATGMGALVAASSTGQLLANLGPLAVAALATTAEQAASGHFVAAVTVARIPLFLFAAIQAVFLPSLAAHVARSAIAAYRARVRSILMVTAAIAGLGLAGMAVLGQWLIRLVYGPEFEISWTVLMLITASGVVFMVAQVFAQALLARRREALVTAGWSLGIVAALVALIPISEITMRVALSLCVGSVVALLMLGCQYIGATQRWQARLVADGRKEPAKPDGRMDDERA